MKDNKDKKIEVRVTAEEKERILQYCEQKGLKISEFIRALCNRAIALEEVKNEQG